MANQTITVSTNHDDLTGRAAGEDITINNGAILTIDSEVHLTSSGIMGLITCNDGEIHFDGTRTFEVTYSSGSGTLPAIKAALSWNSGTDTGKVIKLNSGDNASGVLTLTKVAGTVTPEASDVLVSGDWTATISSVKVGFIRFFGEDQDWVAPDAKATFRITGDWYEIGVGTGADSQTITLPHSGHQHAVWVETGEGTGVYEIWHRISSAASTVFYDSFAEFGTHYESGKVFQQAFGSSTLTFGTSTAGGAPALNAKIRIPNIHLGTTTVGTPTVEVNSTTLASHFKPIADGTTENVYIDKAQFSSVQLSLIQTNGATIKNSCFGLAAPTFLQRNNAAVLLENCAFVQPSVNTTGGLAASVVYTITDNLGGITFKNTLWFGGSDTSAGQCLALTTMANLILEGTNKIVLNITDENTSYALRVTQSSNITMTSSDTLILLGGGIIASAGSNDWILYNTKFGYPPNRGTTEANQNAFALTGCDTWLIDGFNLVSGGKWPTIGPFILTDCANIDIQNAGTVSSKLNGAARLTYVISLNGITKNVRLRRLFFTNLNGTETYLSVNSVDSVLIENCSSDYGDELEADFNNSLVKGLHIASGTPDAATGVEGDMPNVVGTCFVDYFKSDTTGALGLIFDAPGTFHAADITISAGTPIFSGLADLLMRTTGDQVIYTWPYWIKGHTSFQNAAVQLAGTNTGNHTYKYRLDTGSGFSGEFKTIDGTNLSAETISPAGFKIQIEITCTTGVSTNALKGFAILTNTTISDQAANLYPLAVATVELTGLIAGSEVRAYLGTDPNTATELGSIESTTLSTFSFTQSNAGSTGYIVVVSLGYKPIYLPITYSATDVSIPIQQVLDRVYSNPA